MQLQRKDLSFENVEIGCFQVYVWGFFGHIGQQTIDVYIADIQAGLKHLHVEEPGTKWGKERRKILLLHSWWGCKSRIIF